MSRVLWVFATLGFASVSAWKPDDFLPATWWGKSGLLVLFLWTIGLGIQASYKLRKKLDRRDDKVRRMAGYLPVWASIGDIFSVWGELTEPTIPYSEKRAGALVKNLKDLVDEYRETIRDLHPEVAEKHRQVCRTLKGALSRDESKVSKYLVSPLARLAILYSSEVKYLAVPLSTDERAAQREYIKREGRYRSRPSTPSEDPQTPRTDS